MMFFVMNFQLFAADYRFKFRVIILEFREADLRGGAKIPDSSISGLEYHPQFYVLSI